MISRLPRWVWAGAWLLALVAGMINVVGLLGFEHGAVSHLTGTTSLLGAALARAELIQATQLFLLVFSFLAGAVLSGIIIQDSTLKLGRHYGFVLFLEAILLMIAVPLLQRQSHLGTYLAACACGLQNAMVSTFSGAVIRTTHLSGMFTDLGIFLGHTIRGLPVDKRRLQLCFLIISGFLCGGVCGTFIFARSGYATLYFPAILTGSAALGYTLYTLSRKPSSAVNLS
ncbi:MAG: YoaK family protein [Verrucomicrobiota bacterium]|nr:YoaK family protein [Verrucomicrobiota bacterium]